jgi:hypothetical protein
VTDPHAIAGIRQWAAVGVGFFGVGLVFFGIRALQIYPASLGAPFWMVGWTIATVVVAARCMHWWRRAYPDIRDQRTSILAARSQADTG